MQYNVIATIQGTYFDPRPAPVEVPYYSGADLAVALVAVGQAATMADPGFVRLLSVRIDSVQEVMVVRKLPDTTEGHPASAEGPSFASLAEAREWIADQETPAHWSVR